MRQRWPDLFFRRATICSGLLCVVACNQAVSVSPHPHAFAPNSLHGFAPEFLSACELMGWKATCDNPLYTDDQGFAVDKTMYGPHAFIAPAPDLSTPATDNEFSTPRLAALVFVKTPSAGPLPEPYTALGLSPGANCVYLHFQAGAYKAYIQSVTGSCPTSYASGTPGHDVKAVQNPSPWNTPPDASIAANVPAVARFHEALIQKGTPATALGMRCGQKWCIVLPEPRASDRPGTHAGKHSNRRGWSIHGWGDAQQVANVDVATGALTRSDHDVSILPVDNLDSKTWTPPTGDHPDETQHAATIVFSNEPSGIYSDRYHFRQGENELYLWRDTASPTGWSGEVQNKSWEWWLFIPHLVTHHIPVYVELRHPGTTPPATARMRWSAEDEDFWVKCDGCCYVSFF